MLGRLALSRDPLDDVADYGMAGYGPAGTAFIPESKP